MIFMARVTITDLIMSIRCIYFRHSAFLALLIFLIAQTGPAPGETIPFDRAWKEQGFFRLWSNDYKPEGRRLEVISDGTVSLFYRPLPENLRGARRARWEWAVRQGVRATDLTRKGGDDRNLALYFVFADPKAARKLARASAARLMRHAGTRALIYVWGGDYESGTVLASPYGEGRLKTVIRRPAGTGRFRETADLRADFRRAFGTDPGVLVGVAVSADSDDTDGRIEAFIEDLMIE